MKDEMIVIDNWCLMPEKRFCHKITLLKGLAAVLKIIETYLYIFMISLFGSRYWDFSVSEREAFLSWRMI